MSDSWKNDLPEEFRSALSDSLYVPLPPKIIAKQDDGQTSFLERIIRELLKVLKQLDTDTRGDDA